MERKQIIGLWNGNAVATLVTEEDLMEHIKDREKYAGPWEIKHKESDYFDGRISTSFEHFAFDPFTGEKIDWKKLRIEHKQHDSGRTD